MRPRSRMGLRIAAGALAGWLCALCACTQPAANNTSLAHPQRTAVAVESPQSEFKELFAAVQQAKIFPDSKTFADATPKKTPAKILALYAEQAPRTAESLKQFVAENFALPVDAAPVQVPPHLGLGAHIDALWPLLTRRTPAVPAFSSLLPLQRPYVVPGGRFREMYYWDSYFTLLGLIASGQRRLAEDMVQNFAYLIDTYGHVPNGTRSYYLSRSQPPFFFAMAGLLDENRAAAYARYLPQLRREYAFWMEGADTLQPGAAHRRVVSLGRDALLNRYWDDADTPRDESYREDVALAAQTTREPKQLYRDLRAAAESGWDFSSRWFADGSTLASIQTTNIIPIDLNSLLYGLENAIREGCAYQRDTRCAKEFAARAARRKSAIDRYLWDGQAGVYYDYDWTRSERIARLSAAVLYPLFTSLASSEQAQSVALAARAQLLRAGGIVATPIDTRQQWDAPNGWAPLQWIAIDGLRRYGSNELADQIACRWLAAVQRVYNDSGKLVEKYDVMNPDRRGGGGEYPLQDGFGWTNGVTRKLLESNPGYLSNTEAQRCAQS